jgi:hypothetical protein
LGVAKQKDKLCTQKPTLYNLVSISALSESAVEQKVNDPFMTTIVIIPGYVPFKTKINKYLDVPVKSGTMMVHESGVHNGFKVVCVTQPKWHVDLPG